MVNDKDVNSVLKLLPKKANYYFVRASIPRALNENELQLLATKYKLKGKSFSNVLDGIKAAQKNANKNDFIFVGGSTFVVADALRDFN